jgi:serine/threonine protein kinase
MSVSAAAILPTPKSQLLGKTLASGWTLIERLEPSKGSSGGNFGVGYKATKGNEVAFVKAIDFVEALNADDPLLELTKLSAIANFEKEVLAFCAERRMSKILRYIGHEYISSDDSNNPLTRVSCLIMESGTEDLRRLLNTSGAASCAWNLQVLKDVALAISQLHKAGIAHQDIKPSNVIEVATSIQGKNAMKVGDLGRVVRRTQAGPFDGLAWPGDPRYAPPERWYNYIPADWSDARDASDAYMLGSLMIYLFTGATLQSLVVNILPSAFLPGTWSGSFDQDLMPVLVDVHLRVLNEHLLPRLDPALADAIYAIARNLTHPDPFKRGDANARKQAGRPVGMDRLHQKLMAIVFRSMAIERGKRPA